MSSKSSSKTRRGGDLRRGAYAAGDWGGGAGYASQLGGADGDERGAGGSGEEAFGDAEFICDGRAISSQRTCGGSGAAVGAVGVSFGGGVADRDAGVGERDGYWGGDGEADQRGGVECDLSGKQRLDTLWAGLSVCAGGGGAAGIGLGAGERSTAAVGGDGDAGGEGGGGGDGAAQR